MLRLIRLLIAAVAAAYLIVFAVQNRGAVDIVLWPGLVPITAPVWSIALIATIFGIVLGGVSVWLAGLSWRSRAAAAQRRLRAQEERREAAERREEQAAAMRAAERRKEAEADQRGRPVGPALAAPVTGTKPLAISSS
jgi:uncharacterized membrane protein (DUF106 family)